MWIKYLTIFLINVLLFLTSSVKADIPKYIIGNNEGKINQRIDSFFIKYPKVKKVFLVPEIQGKSRYIFSIHKDAYLISKKYFDASDLYYLTEKVDEGLKFKLNESKRIDIFALKNNFNVIYWQKHLQGINTGIFFAKKENSLGAILNKDFIISKNAMANLEFKKAKDNHTVFDSKFVKLSNNENSEIYGNLSYEFKSDNLNFGIGHTWFEVANQYDLTIGIEEKGKKTVSNFYATFGDERKKFQIGLDQIENISEMTVFFNIKLENNLEKKKFGTNVIISSKENIYGLNNISLKSFRKKNLDMLWRKYMNYN